MMRTLLLACLVLAACGGPEWMGGSDYSEELEDYAESKAEAERYGQVDECAIYPERCRDQQPHVFVERPPESGCPNGCTTRPPGCDIKGNVSIETAEKIYHVPGGEFYDATIVAPEYGERWFCTEAEAIANGWRKSKR